MMSLLCHPPLFNFNLLEELITHTSEFDDIGNEEKNGDQPVSENYEYSRNNEISTDNNNYNNDKDNNERMKSNDSKHVDNEGNIDVSTTGPHKENKFSAEESNNHQPFSTSSLPPLSLTIPVPRIPNDDSDNFQDCRHFLSLSRPGNYSILSLLFSSFILFLFSSFSSLVFYSFFYFVLC